MLAGALLATLAALLAGGCGSTTPRAHSRYPTVSVTVGQRAVSQPLASGFLGLSLEYTAVTPYTGTDPRAIDPVLIQLIRNLAPGQRPVLRIGGNSTDVTWFPARAEPPPFNARYALSERWLRSTAALASALNARLIMGLNLDGRRARAAANEARAFLERIGRSHIESFEIGNEPDEYRQPYTLTDYVEQFTRWRHALGRGAPVTGPAYATLNWSLARFIDSQPGLRLVTVHRYPLRACLTNPTAPGYPTIASLLSDQASAGFARTLAPYVAVAHRHRVAFRLDELNSASCSGKRGVSDTFASALWMLDTLFNLARIGVDGVNVHTLPGAAYQPFALRHTRSGWQATVYPEYYAMLMFAQACPPGARLLRVSSPHGPVSAWATGGSTQAVRAVLINKDPRRTFQISLRVRGEAGPGQLERLTAPHLSSVHGVAFGAQTFGSVTRSGQLPALRSERITPEDGVYSITLPAASAALLTS